MKRCLFSFALFLLAALSLQAKDGDQLTLQSGSAGVIWNLASAYFETDWSEAIVDGKNWDEWLRSKGDDFVRDWPSDKQKVEDYFVSRFNKKTGKKRGMDVQTSNPNESYHMIIRPQEVDMGSIGGGVVASAFLGSFAKKSGGVNFKTGYVDIVKVETGRVLCRLAFNNVRGNSGMNVNSQLMFVFEDLVDEILGFAERFGNQQREELYIERGIPSSLEQTQPVQTAQQVSVKLKNGATITGILKSFDPLEKIVLVIAGQETTIPMEKVENVEMSQAAVSLSAQARPTQGSVVVRQTADDTNRLGSRKLLVTETTEYPERITIEIGGSPVEMILVKGGKMNMGFDGDHSLAMESEPVHEVEVSSFYMSTKPLSSVALSSIMKTKHDDMGNAIVEKYKDVETIVTTIQKVSGKPYRITTEAEWEYAASCDLQNQFFADVAKQEKIAYDWCSDYYDVFKEGSVIVDPTGPVKGSNRVVRAYNNKYGKYNRNNKISQGRFILGYLRLVIKAKDTL